jgi:hypothetical protein
MPSTEDLAVYFATLRASDRPSAGRVCAAPVDPATGLTGIGDERQPEGEGEELAPAPKVLRPEAPALGAGALLCTWDPVRGRDAAGEWLEDYLGGKPAQWELLQSFRGSTLTLAHAPESAARPAGRECR